MNMLTVFLTFFAVAGPPVVEAMRARRRLDDALVARGSLPRHPGRGLPPGMSMLEALRLFVVTWGRQDTIRVDLAIEDFERSKQAAKLGHDLPEGRAAGRWTIAALLLWLLGLPLVLMLLPTADRVVSVVVPAFAVIRVPLVIAGCWAVWHAIRVARSAASGGS